MNSVSLTWFHIGYAKTERKACTFQTFSNYLPHQSKLSNNHFTVKTVLHNAKLREIGTVKTCSNGGGLQKDIVKAKSRKEIKLRNMEAKYTKWHEVM